MLSPNIFRRRGCGGSHSRLCSSVLPFLVEPSWEYGVEWRFEWKKCRRERMRVGEEEEQRTDWEEDWEFEEGDEP